MKRFKSSKSLQFGTALLVSAIGGFWANHFGVPAAFILGGTLAVAIYSLMGGPVHLPIRIRDTVFCIIGVTMGSSVTPDVLDAAATWPGSFLMLIASVVAITFASKTVLMRFLGLSKNSAWLAAAPGHLSYVLGVGLSMGQSVPKDLGQITIAQSIRVIGLTLSLPFIVTALVAATVTDGEAASFIVPDNMAFVHMCLVIAVAGLLGWALDRFKIPAAFLLGGLLTAAVTHITNLTPGGMPFYLTIPAFLIMGVLIGGRFAGVTFRELKDAMLAGLIITFISMSVAMVCAILVWIALGIPFTQVMLAFTPGALEAMGALAILLDAEPTYVAAHHVLRLLAITVMMPILVRR